jgi:hypothetical protein
MSGPSLHTNIAKPTFLAPFKAVGAKISAGRAKVSAAFNRANTETVRNNIQRAAVTASLTGSIGTIVTIVKVGAAAAFLTVTPFNILFLVGLGLALIVALLTIARVNKRMAAEQRSDSSLPAHLSAAGTARIIAKNVLQTAFALPIVTFKAVKTCAKGAKNVAIAAKNKIGAKAKETQLREDAAQVRAAKAKARG